MMTPQRIFILAMSVTALAGAFLPVHQAKAQNTVIRLDYGDSGGTCNFNTAGIAISGSSANLIDATGQFAPGSNCPTGGGSTTGIAAVNLAASPTTIDEQGSSHIQWSATADVCRFDGSNLPGAINGWQTTGDACIGASDCQAGGNINPVFNIAGTYNFKLTCLSGAHDSQPQTQAVKNVSVTVNGEAPPDPGNCVAPAGLTRDLTGTISSSSGSHSHSNVNMTEWDNVFGYNLSTGDIQAWPGQPSTDIKFSLKKNHYYALRFTVGANFPYTTAGGWNSGYGPYGTFSTNATNATLGVLWTMSITPDCGDFTQPLTGPDRGCYQQFTITGQGGGWVVLPSGQNGGLLTCTLHRGQTYYMNILPSPLGDPLNTSGTGCNSTITACKNNFQHFGNFDGAQGL